MEKIDVIILTNNEEDVIENALKSIKGWAKNIIVVDSGSTDRTLEIAKKYEAEILSSKFIDFSQQRNFAIKQAKSPWVMYLDADERVTSEFKSELEIAIENDR